MILIRFCAVLVLKSPRDPPASTLPTHESVCILDWIGGEGETVKEFSHRCIFSDF